MLGSKPKLSHSGKEKFTGTFESKAPIGTWVFEVSIGGIGLTGVKNPKAEGGLKGNLIKVPTLNISEGIVAKDVELDMAGKIVVEASLAAVIAHIVFEDLAKKELQEMAESIGEDAAIAGGIEVGLGLVGIAAVAGMINESAKAADISKLRDLVADNIDHWARSAKAALIGEATSPFQDQAGSFGFDNGKANLKQQRVDRLSNADAQKIVDQVLPGMKRQFGENAWKGWVSGHHGATTFPQHAKLAWTACFNAPMDDEADPNFQLWVKANGD
jgi:hypothetical protein